MPIDKARTVINFPNAGIVPSSDTSRKAVRRLLVRHERIRPFEDRILEARRKRSDQGGIVIPDTTKEKPQEGKIVAVGKGKHTDESKLIPIEVKPGDKTLFGKYSAASTSSRAKTC